MGSGYERNLYRSQEEMNQVRSLLGSWGREAKEPVTLRLAELAVLDIQRTLGMLSAISKRYFLERVSPQKTLNRK